MNKDCMSRNYGWNKSKKLNLVGLHRFRTSKSDHLESIGNGFYKYFSCRLWIGAQMIYPIWRHSRGSIFPQIWWANQVYSKKPHEKRISVTKDMNFWRRRSENSFLQMNFCQVRNVSSLAANRAKAISMVERFLRTLVSSALFVSGTFWSFYGFSSFPKW